MCVDGGSSTCVGFLVLAPITIWTLSMSFGTLNFFSIDILRQWPLKRSGELQKVISTKTYRKGIK